MPPRSQHSRMWGPPPEAVVVYKIITPAPDLMRPTPFPRAPKTLEEGGGLDFIKPLQNQSPHPQQSFEGGVFDFV